MSEIKQITIEDNEPFLRQISKEVKLPDPTLKDDTAILDEFCKWDAVLAMAAVQLGIPKRLIYLKEGEKYFKNTLYIPHDLDIIEMN